LPVAKGLPDEPASVVNSKRRASVMLVAALMVTVS